MMAAAAPGQERRDRENKLLEQLYNTKVKLDEQAAKKNEKVLHKVLDDVLWKARELSPIFDQLFWKIYKGGSYYDKLKIKTTDFEFDLNIIFKIPNTHWYIDKLGTDVRKPNFAALQSSTSSSPASQVWEEMQAKDSQGSSVISPKKMFDLVQKSVDKSLTALQNSVSCNKEKFRCKIEKEKSPK